MAPGRAGAAERASPARAALLAALAAAAARLWHLQAVVIGHQPSNKHEVRTKAQRTRAHESA